MGHTEAIGKSGHIFLTIIASRHIDVLRNLLTLSLAFLSASYSSRVAVMVWKGTIHDVAVDTPHTTINLAQNLAIATIHR